MTNYSHLQYALFQAAKVGNVKLMREFIVAGADPFAWDENNRNAIFYARKQNKIEADVLLLELCSKG